MNRLATVLVVGLLAAAALGAVPAAGGAQPSVAADTNASAVSPGAHLSGAIGVHGAEVEGELDRRRFGLEVARAASDEARADVVRANLDAAETRLVALRERKRALERARANGTITNGSYHARMAVLVAQTRTLQHRLNASETASADLPAALREREGIDASAIRTLQRNASELTGPDAAAIAVTIAGPDIGRSIATGRAPVTPGPPDDVGPDASPGAAGNATGPTDHPTGPPGSNAGKANGNGIPGPKNGGPAAGNASAMVTPDD